MISLIRSYLNARVMINGVANTTIEGVPQVGNLLPLLIMLNELDKELEKRGLNFCRYADDTVTFYVKSKKSAIRVMESITRFIET